MENPKICKAVRLNPDSTDLKCEDFDVFKKVKFLGLKEFCISQNPIPLKKLKIEVEKMRTIFKHIKFEKYLEVENNEEEEEDEDNDEEIQEEKSTRGNNDKKNNN